MTTEEINMECELTINDEGSVESMTLDVNFNNTTGEIYVYCPHCRKGIKPHNGECNSKTHTFTILEFDVNEIMELFQDEILEWFKHKEVLGSW